MKLQTELKPVQFHTGSSPKPLTGREKAVLKEFRLADAPVEGMIPVAELFRAETLEPFIGRFAETIGTESRKVAASVFMKRYAFLAVLSLYSMTTWNKKLNIDPANIRIEAPVPGEKYLPKFYFAKAEAEQFEGTDRISWRRDVVTDLFAEHLSPLINLLVKTTGVSKLILWENVAVYILWLYETVLAGMANKDLEYIFRGAEGQAFGNYARNPLTKYYSEKTYIEDLGQMVRVRKTCCFSNLTAEKNDRCKICPCRQLELEGRCTSGPTDVCDAVRGLT